MNKNLAAVLKRKITGEVRFDDGSRALYATDASNYRQVPIGVVIPRSIDDVVATVATAREFGVPILPRGGGTSLAGQCCNVAVVVDFSKYMNRLLEIDPDKKLARVQPGLVLDELQKAAKRFQLTFGPDPATHSHCTFGGMIGNNSCGIHSVMAGRTVDNVEELDILTYRGERMRVGRNDENRRGEIFDRLRALRDRFADKIRARYPKIPRRVSGYNLDELLPENGLNVAGALVGTEGTCVTVLEAKVRLVHSPPARTLVVLGYEDVYSAGDHILEVLAHQPVGLEGIDDVLVNAARKQGLNPEALPFLPEGNGWLIVEFGGETSEEANEKAHRLIEALRKRADGRLFDNPEQQRLIWKIRESGLGATAHVPGEKIRWEGWEDSAVPPASVGAYLRSLRKLLDKFGYHCTLYGHFGEGCIHTRIDFDLETEAGIEKYRRFVSEAAELVVSYRGSISGEHGDGQSKGELLPIMFGEDLVGAFREFKSIWDPDWKMNPGKVVEPYRNNENLRLGANYRPWQPQTHFQYPQDHGNFAKTLLRCVGVGECRRHEKATMCPSYMVTREEMHSTRGRAHLLFEMLQGDVVRDGWRSRHVKEALDLCLSCKGCKGDCPVNVDVATYKAEFLSHYYAHRLRPRSAYAMGLIYWWARAASLAPGLVNFAGKIPVTKFIAGISPKRQMPRFAAQTFRKQHELSFRACEESQAYRPNDFRDSSQARNDRSNKALRVLLWPDTFNNHFHPEILKAAVEVLERAGCDVILPERSLCCGRPLYDFGMLNLAKRMLRQILRCLEPVIRQGIPIVVLEPSCLSVFRDELHGLFPHDEDAMRLRRLTRTLSEFLNENGFEPPKLYRKALVHGHCHHKSILKFDVDKKLLEKLGLDFEILDSGCCGMAGAFGFEKDHYDVSVACAERALLPAVRAAAPETLIIADGFSCREQIAQLTNRSAMHLAELIRMGLRETKPV
jgi:FAD/FMN-containing dehydrogenase/Fe-S oxidoreductase